MINRITNFNLLRCRLKVKFVLNGNGFHYGRAIASYVPLHTDDTFSMDRAFFIQDVIGASQRPHVYLDPTMSVGGTLSLPFVYPYNALDIPDGQWSEMGDIIIHGMQNLKHANGASDSVTVSVFVWAEDVVMSTPTSNEPAALVPQMGKLASKDEYGTGIISKPAAAVAKIAGALQNAPVIGSYAKATQLAASAVSSIATAFGYSRPNNLSEIQPYRPTLMGNLANTNYPDSATKLTFDAKQELTCDTSTFGLDGTDEMTIKSIATRESFLTAFPWDVIDTTESLIWNTRVNPVIWDTLGTGIFTEYHMPACCFAALPFKHWRGTMKFRFQVVASSFHKGRLKVVYDPSYAKSNEYNTNYTRVIDLAEERDFTVEIGWGQQTPFLNHLDMITSTTKIFGTTAIASDPSSFANGVLSVYVLNELTIPNSVANNDVAVNVFVSMGDDFEVANPTDLPLAELSWFRPQMGVLDPQSGALGEVAPDSTNTTMENAPMKLDPDERIAPSISSCDHTMDVFYGDPITSVRQLLKRYNYSQAIVSGTAVGWKISRYYQNNFPLYRGFDPNGIDTATTSIATTENYNFVKTTWLNYYTPAYVCWRGGIKWKYQLLTDDNKNNSFMMVDRLGNQEFASSVGSVTLLDDSNSISKRSKLWADLLSAGQAGSHVTAAGQNPCLEVEFPYFDFSRFTFGKMSNLDLSIGIHNFFHKILWKEQTLTTSHNVVNAYVAAGEDFTLGFFTGAPVAYRQVSPVAV